MSREAVPSSPFEQAEALLARGRNAEAAKLLEKVIEEQPFNDGAYAELGMCRLRSGDSGGAIRALERGLRHHPNSFVLLDRLGTADFELRRFADARRLWQRCLALVPGSELVRQQLATLPDGE